MRGAYRVGAAALFLASSAVGTVPAAGQDGPAWVPTAFAEQNAAAWVLWRVLCDPTYPGAAPPAGVAAAYCDGLRASGMAYLEVILALTAMANTGAIPPFPVPDGIAGAIIATQAQEAQPDWVIVPNNGAVQLPQMVPVVVQAMLSGYQSMIRTTLLAQAVRLEAVGGGAGAGVPAGDARGDAVVDGAAAMPATPAP